MKITKLNETFSLTETTEVFEMSGSVTSETSGSLNLHFNVNKVGGEHAGDCHYNKYGESETVNFVVNCTEENRDEFTSYANTVIARTLDHLKADN